MKSKQKDPDIHLIIHLIHFRVRWHIITKAEEKAGREWQEQYLKEAFNESSKLIETAKEHKGFLT